jgi:hypothetical protein
MQKIEFGIGFVIFMVSFSFVIHSLLSLEYEREGPMEGEILLESFVKDEGSPVSWNASTVEEIGLASGPNILDREKIEELMRMEYKDVKVLLGIEGEFRIRLESDHYQFSYGKALPQQKAVQTFERPVIIENELGKFWLYYWW